MDVTAIKERVASHIAKGPEREWEALLQSRLNPVLRTVRKELLEARERRDVATESILKAVSAAFIYRNMP